MRIFIGGVMQASHHGSQLESQDYRRAIREALHARWPEIEIIDPYMLHPNSVVYDDAEAKATLFTSLGQAESSDLVIAYVPVASMGTALEMYVAHQSGVPVVAISPLKANWVVRSLARRIYPDLAAFLAHIAAAGGPAELGQGV